MPCPRATAVPSSRIAATVRGTLVRACLALTVPACATAACAAPVCGEGFPSHPAAACMHAAGPRLPRAHRHAASPEAGFGDAVPDPASGIAIHRLDHVQIENLVTLGKVWGFLKYYHPAVTAGRLPWDRELFRVLPNVLAAPDRAHADAVLLAWIDGLGPVPRCHVCAQRDRRGLQQRPALGWITNSRRLGGALSRRLQWIRAQRRPGRQYYVALAPHVGNPVFRHEPAYRDVAFPDAGFQLLALYRLWNIVEYWYPDRHLSGENWDRVLASFIPRLALARSRSAYARQLMALLATLHDTHANLWSSLALRPPVGDCRLPVQLRFIQRQAVVAHVHGTAALRRGDIIERLDGRTVSAWVRAWSPYYADSNEAARLRDIATDMTRGACGPVALTVRRRGHNLHLAPRRVAAMPAHAGPAFHDLPGPAFRHLAPGVAYLKLSTARPGRVGTYIQQAAGSRGLIIDARGYPRRFMVFALGSRLVTRPTPFARITVGDLSHPGAFHWTPPQVLQPRPPHYHGRVVILVDAVTQSQAEYTVMALRAAPGALVVGSTTAGADGNVSRIPLPGGMSGLISGIGVYGPDWRPTQRVGIVPDVVVRPTVADIRAGRDPVLATAIRLILGPHAPVARIERRLQRVRR